MIFSYCRKCGLYITVPDEFAGGAGSCPRCKRSLLIPTPIPSDSPYYVEGLRYLTNPVGVPIPDGLPAIAMTAHGPSFCYECPHCGDKYESLKAAGYRQGTCPKCSSVNTPVGDEVKFPRNYCTPEDGTKPLKMDGEFLLAQPSIDQAPSDSIIQGVIISDDDAEVHEEPVEISGDEPQTVIPPVSAVKSAPKNTKWSYLQKGKPVGPVSAAELMRLQQSGKINPSTPVWKHGMDGWVPIDNFPQLLYRPSEPTSKPDTKAKPQLTQHQLSRNLLRHCQCFFWAFIAITSLVVLVFITQQTFEDLGAKTIQAVSIGVAFLIICILIYGIAFLVINRKRVKSLPSIVRIQGIGGTLGLMGCLVIMLVVGFQTPQENKQTKTDTQWPIQHAKEVAEVFAKSNTRQSHNLVKWDEFRLNGEDIGKKYSGTDSPTEQNKIIAGVFLAFNEGMKPLPPKPALESKDEIENIATSRPAGDSLKDSVKDSVTNLEETGKDAEKIVPKKPEIPKLINWELASNPSSHVVVEATNSVNKNKFVFTFNIGMLIQLEIKEHQKK